MFRYYNMDHAIESGIATAERIIKRQAGTEGKGVSCHCGEAVTTDEAIAERHGAARKDDKIASLRSQ
jgi:hypothetical protein